MKRLKHLLLFSILIFSLFSYRVKAEDWGYYKEITISNFSADYQVKITVHYGSGTDSTDVVYLNSHCRTDFSDIRFRESNQTTNLSYWIEEYTTGDEATVWVKLPSSSQTIYIYYGNSEATDQGNVNDVFIFYDDFPGSSLDTNKWTTGGQGTLAVTDGYVYASSFGTGSGWHGPEAVATFNTTTDFIVETRMVFDHYQSSDLGFNRMYLENSSDWKIRFIISDSHAEETQYRKLADDQTYTYWDTGTPGSGSDGEHDWCLQRSGLNMVVKYDGVQKYSGTCITDTVDRVRFMFWQYSTYNDIWMTVQYIKIRKYASPAPSFTFGSEQTTNSPPNTPTNQSPTNGATNQSLNPVLTWSEYSDPDSDPQQAWEVHVDNNSDMSSPEWEGSGVTGNSITVNTTNGNFSNDCTGQVELDEDETYYWDVRVQDDKDNWSDRSTATNFTTGEFSPYQPTNQSPSDQSTGASLNPTLQFTYSDPNSDPQQNSDILLDDNSDFSSKEWWTGLMGGGAVTSIVVNVSNGTFYNNCDGQTKLDENTLYYWEVRVQDDTGRWSIYSGSTQFTTGSVPAAPTGCSATYVSDSQIDLSWTDNSSNETGFQIYRSVDSGGYSLLKTEPENSTGSNDTDVSADHTYQYKVRSYNDVGNSDYCETSQVATTPSAPSNVSANLQGTTITITWTDNSSITDLHQIERSIDGGDWEYLDEDSDGTYEDTWQEAWNSVKYRLRAKCTVGPRYSSWVESNTLTSNQPPSADFTFWGSGDYKVSFDASASTDPDNDELTFSWDFGNGSTDEGVLVTHNYETGGEWTVTLTVSDGKDQDQIQKTVSINVAGGDLRPYSAPNSSERKPSEVPFEIIGKKTKESVEFLLDNNLGLILIIIVVIVLAFAMKNKL
ncbi:MAG: hypothetical protein AYK18_07005 [Theionarchaea archaeon DG-70]|nr:MAG: hypothetical protein AYK18_07005 [Theionarchaea archaeon DG-70]